MSSDASPAVSHLSIQAIDPTFPRTEPTFLEKFFQKLDPLFEFSFFKEADIGRGRSQFKIAPWKILTS